MHTWNELKSNRNSHPLLALQTCKYFLQGNFFLMLLFVKLILDFNDLVLKFY